MRGELTGVKYTKNHNFHLMSMTRLLCKGWSITKASQLKNGSDDMIDSDFKIHTERGSVFVSRFVRGTEIGVVSTDSGTNMNIIKDHGMLGHGNKDWTW